MKAFLRGFAPGDKSISYFRRLFYAGTIISFLVLLMCLVGNAIFIFYRVLYFMKTGHFALNGPPSSVKPILEAQRVLIVDTLCSFVLPLVWLYDWRKRQK